MTEVLKVEIRYINPELPEITKIKGGDWVDLRAGETVRMKQGEYQLIPLGVSIKLPTGYEALVVPRSSTFKNYGILMANSIGIIDESYCGDDDQWGFPAYATRDTVIKMGDRICQFRIIKHQEFIEFKTVLTHGTENRGGFGSTGRR